MPPHPEESHWFSLHVQPHAATLRAWLARKFPSELDPDDVLQEAYVRTWQAWERGEVRSAKAFLFATARNLALDRARRRRVVPIEPLVKEEALSVLEEGVDVPEAVARNQEFSLLSEAIQSLPERCRQIFLWRKVHGLSQKEIARRLGISEHTVSAQLTVGLHKCTAFFASRGLQRRARDE